VQVRSYQGVLVVSGREFGHELNIFAINLIALKLFCILPYFLQQNVCSILFSKCSSPHHGSWDFALPTLIYTYCFIIYKAKDAKVSFRDTGTWVGQGGK